MPKRTRKRHIQGQADRRERELELVDELIEKVEPHVAKVKSEEGQEEINEPGKVKEIWQDGELTYTKGGELFRKRSLHRIGYPFLEYTKLWKVPEGEDNVSRVIVTEEDKVEKILDEYRKKVMG